LSRLVSVANVLKKFEYDAYFMVSGHTARLVKMANFNIISPPKISPPSPENVFIPDKKERIMPPGTDFWNLGHFYYLKGYSDYEYLKRSLNAKIRKVEKLNPDVIVTYWSWEGKIIGKILKKPVVSIIHSPLHPSGEGFLWWRKKPSQLPDVTPAFNRLLSCLNLPSISKVEDLMVGDLTLIPSIPEFDPLPPDATVTYVGPLLWYPPLKIKPKYQKIIDEFASSSNPSIWVYASTSKYWQGGNKIIKYVLKTFRNTKFNVIISSGYNELNIEYINQRFQNIKAVPYVPLNFIKKCKFILHRGGHHTYMTSIALGVPSISFPPNAEWLSYAYRARELGIGEFIELKELSEKRIKEVMEEFLAKYNSYKERIVDLSKKIGTYGGPEKAAELIHKLINTIK